MTSNLGVKKLQDFGVGVGFRTTNEYTNEEIRKETLQKELKKFFSPEFLNRIDDIVIFNSLNKEHIGNIVNIELDKLKERLESLKYNISFDKSIEEMISKIGFDDLYGARPLKRAIQEKIEDYISEEVLKGSIKEGTKYVLKADEDEKITISKSKKSK